MLRSKFVKFLMSILKRQVDSSPNFASLFSFMKDNSSVLFLAQTIYTLLKRSTLKWEFLRLSSAGIKIRLNSLCQFWNDKSIPLQTKHRSSWHITPLWILSSYVFYFRLKDPIKVPILRLLSALVKIFHIPHVDFASPFSVMKDNSSVLFKIKH